MSTYTGVKLLKTVRFLSPPCIYRVGQKAGCFQKFVTPVYVDIEWRVYMYIDVAFIAIQTKARSRGAVGAEVGRR